MKSMYVMTAAVMVCATCFAIDQSNNFQFLKQSGQIENLCHPFPKERPELYFCSDGLSANERERWNDGCNYLITMEAEKDLPGGLITSSNRVEKFKELDKAIAKNEIRLLRKSKEKLESVVCSNQTEQKELNQALKLVTDQIKERYEKFKKLSAKPKSKIIAKMVSE